MPAQPNEWFHVGIVADDISAAAARITAATGTQWTKPLGAQIVMRYPDGDRLTEMKFKFTLTKPYMEVVQAVPGTVFTPAPGNAVHHVAYWVDDLTAASAHLVSLGMPQEVCGVGEDGQPSIFAYHKGADGIRIEIVERGYVPDWDAMVAENAE